MISNFSDIYKLFNNWYISGLYANPDVRPKNRKIRHTTVSKVPISIIYKFYKFTVLKFQLKFLFS